MKIIKLNTIDSTNTYLKKISKQSFCPDQQVVWAMEQTAGRGQQGALWQSEPYKNLTFSVLKRFEKLDVSDYFLLNMAVSLSVYEVLKILEIPNLSLKWSNDILSGGKKICGILIENVINKNYISESIIGIGLNVNQIEFSDLSRVASLQTITGKNFILKELLYQLLDRLFEELIKISKEQAPELFKRYQALLFRKNIPSVFENMATKQRFMGIIKGVTSLGGLIVQLEDNTENIFFQKEIQLLY